VWLLDAVRQSILCLTAFLAPDDGRCVARNMSSYKYGIIHYDTLLHLVGFFCTNISTKSTPVHFSSHDTSV